MEGRIVVLDAGEQPAQLRNGRPLATRLVSMQIPMKPAGYSDLKAATVPN